METDRPGKAAHAFYESLGFAKKGIMEDTDNSNAGHPFQIFDMK